MRKSVWTKIIPFKSFACLIAYTFSALNSTLNTIEKFKEHHSKLVELDIAGSFYDPPRFLAFRKITAAFLLFLTSFTLICTVAFTACQIVQDRSILVRAKAVNAK